MTKLISTLSHTSVSMISKCPRQFWYRYVQGLKIRPSSAMLFGSSYHETHEDNFNHLLECGEPFPLENVLELFSGKWDSAKLNIDWKDEKLSAGALMDIGVMGLSEYYTRILPTKDPKLVEFRFEVQLPEITRTFVGIIDYIGKDGMISDHKTSGKRWNDTRAASEMQPSAYYLGYQYSQDLKELPIKGFTYEVIVKKKTPEVQVLNLNVSETAIADYQSRIKTAEKLIEAEVFPKTDPTNWYCSEKWCGYYPHCMRHEPFVDVPDTF